MYKKTILLLTVITKKANEKVKKLMSKITSISFKDFIDYGSKISTIGIFFLAFFGYIYTVKPKFLYDTLKIKSSKLENKNIELENNIKQHKVDIDNLQKSKKVISTDLENKISVLKDNINKRTEENTHLLNRNNKLYNKNKYVSWRIFIKKVYIQTSTANTWNKKNEYLIFHTKQDKLVIKNNSPYILLKEHFKNLKYSQIYSLINQKDFNDFKMYLINNIEKEKYKLKYDSNIKELTNLQIEFNAKIKKLKKQIDPHNINTVDIYKEIEKIHKKYDIEAKKRYKKVNKIINDFINVISKKYIHNLGLEIKPTINKIDMDQRMYQYGSGSYTLIF